MGKHKLNEMVALNTEYEIEKVKLDKSKRSSYSPIVFNMIAHQKCTWSSGGKNMQMLRYCFFSTFLLLYISMVYLSPLLYF